jgi:DNA polymerase-3 subunit alpha
LKEGNSLILNLVKNITDDENRFKRINVQKISSLKELFNSPINEVSFEVRSKDQVQVISKILKENGKTLVNINLVTEDNILHFKLRNSKNLDRKSLNLLRKQQIQATIS